MALPETRSDLLDEARRAFAGLDDAIDRIPEPQRSSAFPDAALRDHDVRDVVNHLHAWHVLLDGWLDAAAVGRTPAFPAEGYDWVSLDELNHVLRDRYRGVALAAARARLRTSHDRLLVRVAGIDEAELYDASRHPWSSGPLAEPMHECLGGHYEWAIGAIAAARD
ncbi:ClbS/DfsB family four-helix bundle protein [Agromyces sp. NPDC057865]|uniref:ClbS/DfsB family four-helix bundle protein n=1 Tax=Agromyces sp. NPDC057865 TaxID=3346267 RepID=UPI003670BBC6